MSTWLKMIAEVSVGVQTSPCNIVGLLVLHCREKFLLGNALRRPEFSLEAHYSAK